MAYTPTHHCVDYIEIAATDLAATKHFFTELFGWKFTDYGPDYTAFDDGRLNGGFYRVESTDVPAQGAVLVVFYSKDLHKTQDRVEQLGGSISQAIFEFPGGRRFHFLGPDGLQYAVWSQ